MAQVPRTVPGTINHPRENISMFHNTHSRVFFKSYKSSNSLSLAWVLRSKAVLQVLSAG